MKTTEERAQEYAEEAFAKALKAPWPEAKQAFAEAYLKGASESLSSQWHDIDHEKPKIGQKVVWLSKVRTPRGTMLDSCLADTYDGEYMPENTWYWMPIPELPKTEKI